MTTWNIEQTQCHLLEHIIYAYDQRFVATGISESGIEKSKNEVRQ